MSSIKPVCSLTGFFFILAVMLNCSANVDCCCPRMMVRRELLGTASLLLTAVKSESAYKMGKMLISIEKLSSSSK